MRRRTIGTGGRARSRTGQAGADRRPHRRTTEAEDQPDVSIPGGGGDIVVTGPPQRRTSRSATSQVVVGPVERRHRAHRRRRHRRRAQPRHRPQRRRQRLCLCPRPWRSLFAGAAQRLAAAEPRAAQARRAARPVPDQRDRLVAGAEELFGQLPGRIRRRRDQPDDQVGAEAKAS